MAAIPNLVRAAGNEFVTTLASSVTAIDTTMQLTSVTGLSTGGGVLIIDEGNASEERIYYESIAGSIITIATSGRGVYGTSASAHASGATVTDVLVDAHINNLITEFRVGHTDAGVHDSMTLILANTSPTADGSVGFDRTNENLQIGDGTNSQKVHMGAWTSFTPALTNVTLGSGTLTGSYALSGKTCIYRIYLALAADSAIGGAISLGLPLTAATYTGTGLVGYGRIRDVSASKGYDAVHFSNGAVQVKNITGTYLEDVATSSTVPMTWADTDYINITGAYEIA